MIDPEWWRSAVVYEIYPRSFADSNGDGIGDLAGVRSRLEYLAALGIDAIWLSPFYPSPLADGGYDISSYRDVDPRLGTLDDFDRLRAATRELGVKIIIDIVPNHTSEHHPWFRQALAAPAGDPARDRYIFRDGTGPDGMSPPTDWKSHFGGSAWERVADGQWYLHLFAREQPDLNWDNPEIREDFLTTLRFWADRGVDGFRVDVAHSLAKDLTAPLRSQPYLDTLLPLDGTDPLYDREEVHEIYRSWRTLFDEYSPPRMAVAETWVPTNDRTYLYARPSELGQVFDFSLLKSPWGAQRFRNVIERCLSDHASHAEDGGGLTWVLSSHDVPRHASRLALPEEANSDFWLLQDGRHPAIDNETGQRRARAATLMMLALPGSAYLFQGEELGLPEVADLPRDALRDPIWERTGHRIKGRDGCRVPMPWSADQPNFGFSTADPWLPQPATFARYAADRQEDDADSSLRLYRSAIGLRRKLQTQSNLVTWLRPADSDVLHFARDGGWECVVNFSSSPIPMPAGEFLLASRTVSVGAIPGETAVWLRTRGGLADVASR